MNKILARFLLGFVVLTILFSCSRVPDSGEISGVALKEDGTPFGVDAKIVAVDSRGVAAEGKVDAKGNYKVIFPAGSDTFRSGKKSKTFSSTLGNTFLKINEGENTFFLVLPEELTKININVVTVAAAQNLISFTNVNLNSIFDAVKVEIESNHKNYVLIENVETLNALAFVPEMKTEDFSNAAKLVIGAMFGFDTSGATAVKVDNFLTGSIQTKEVFLLKAAASMTKNIFSAIISATNNPDNASFLLNNEKFYEALGKEIANDEEKASKTEFSEVLVKVIQSLEVQMALSEIAHDLDTYVDAVEENSAAPFTVAIPIITVSPSAAILTVSRNIGEVSISTEGVLQNDQTYVRVRVFSLIEETISFEIPVQFDGENFKITQDPIIVTIVYGHLLNLKNSASITSGKINLETLLSETKTVMLEEELPDFYFDYVPDSTVGLKFIVSCSPISRETLNDVATFLTMNSTTVSSITGVNLE